MNFTLSLNTVLPLCIYICLGVLARKLGLMDEKTAAKVNKFAYWILYPVNMFKSTMSVSVGSEGRNAALFICALCLIYYSAILFLSRYFIKSPARRGSFVQGAFRGNCVLFGLPVAESLCAGNTGIFGVIVAVFVPFQNALVVLTFELCRGGKFKLLPVIKKVFTNPMIIGTIAGILFSLTGLTLPEFLYKPVSALGTMTTPTALMMLGATLSLKGVKKDAKAIISALVIKLAIIPTIVLLSGLAFGFRGITLMSLFSVACVPTAAASYTMATQMGGDGPLAGEIVAAGTVVSLATVFLWVLAISPLI